MHKKVSVKFKFETIIFVTTFIHNLLWLISQALNRTGFLLFFPVFMRFLSFFSSSLFYPPPVLLVVRPHKILFWCVFRGKAYKIKEMSSKMRGWGIRLNRRNENPLPKGGMRWRDSGLLEREKKKYGF